MTQEESVAIALLQQEVENLKTEVAQLRSTQQDIRDTMKVGKGMIVALVFLLGSGVLALGEGIKRIFGWE